jgi:hypothetical protein
MQALEVFGEPGHALADQGMAVHEILTVAEVRVSNFAMGSPGKLEQESDAPLCMHGSTRSQVGNIASIHGDQQIAWLKVGRRDHPRAVSAQIKPGISGNRD